MILARLGGPCPNQPDLPDEKFPALYRTLESVDGMNDPEDLVSWHLAAGRVEGGWPNMFLSP